MRASVPANLLILGEYAVLEEGGLGLAVAAEPRVRAEFSLSPGAGLRVVGRMGSGAKLDWSPAFPRGASKAALVEAAVEACRAAGSAGGTLEVDSSALFAGGRKAGYGSSAAAAVALCWGLLALAAGEPPAPAAVLEAALHAHRRSQGGRGSGYDVLASFHGGAGLFTGGVRPSWQPLRLPWLEPLYLFRGARSVPTPGAIGRYQDWKRRRPGEAQRFLEESNRDLLGFLGASSRREAQSWFRRCRERGLWLGEAIGVEASMDPPVPGVPPECCKSLGAGNELGLVFAEEIPAPEAAGLTRVVVARQGLEPETGPETESPQPAWEGGA